MPFPTPKSRTFFSKSFMSSFPSHVPRVVVRAEYFMAELALADTRMLLAAGVAPLHQDHYPIVQHRAIKNSSNGPDFSRTSEHRSLAICRGGRACNDTENRQR